MTRRHALAGVAAAAPLATSRSHALDTITDVSPKDASALGLTVRAQTAAGPNAVWVELTAPAAGKLAGYTHVDLQMYDGEKLLLTTALGNRSNSTDRMQVSFFADRGNLENNTLRVMNDVGEGSVGYALRVKDLVTLP